MKDLNQIYNFSQDYISNEIFRRASYTTLLDSLAYSFGMGVAGDIVEFGTMTGRTAVCLSTGLKILNSRYRGDDRGGKRIFFFDSFEGLPAAVSKPDLENPHVISGVWERGTCKGLDAFEFSQLIQKILPTSDFTVVPGYFDTSLRAISVDQKFSVVHVDVDLYQSTIDSLGYLFEHAMVSKGAHILFDDFYCASSSPIHGEMCAWNELVEKHRIIVENLGPYQIAGKRFLVLDY